MPIRLVSHIMPIRLVSHIMPIRRSTSRALPASCRRGGSALQSFGSSNSTWVIDR
jgi:hypothetical protein